MKFENSTTSFFTRLQTGIVFSGGLIHTEQGDSSSLTFKGRLAQDALRDISLGFLSIVKGIESDNKLTPEGKLPQIKDEGKKAFKKISELYKKTLEAIQNEYFITRHNLLNVKKDDETPAQVLREIDTRNLLLQLDESKRLEIMTQAMQDKNEQVITAFLNTPAFVNILNPKILNIAKIELSKIQNPEIASKFDSISPVYQKTAIAFSDAVGAIADMGDTLTENELYKFQRLSADLMSKDAFSLPPVTDIFNEGIFE